MSKDETFDEFRLRREIERMEQEFRKRATVQRDRVEQLLAGDERTEEIERKVQLEMQEFLMDSTSAAEEVLEQYAGAEGAGAQAQEQLKGKLREFITGMSEAPGEESKGAAARPPASARAQGSAPTRDLQVERRPLGVVSKSPRPRDLRSALQKLRGSSQRHAGHPVEAPEQEEVLRGRTRSHILDRFDNALDGFTNILAQGEEAGGAPPPSPAPEAHQHSRGRGPGDRGGGLGVIESGLPPIADPDAEFSPDSFSPDPIAEMADPPLGGRFDSQPGPALEPMPMPISGDAGRREPRSVRNEGPPASPAGTRNVFEDDPGEDADIDEKLEIADPEGWDLPSGPEAPGAWVVARQKEEGDAGLSGIAGDSYLMKKLCQEVRNLNRLYLALLEKGVVQRGDVEGPGGGATRPAGAGDDEDDDDAVSVEDFTEERYRPILTSDQDFSLSGLVADVHRLKTLREVLIKKKVVTEKELKKAEG